MTKQIPLWRTVNLNFIPGAKSPEKFLVIVDDENITSFDEVMQNLKSNMHIVYILTDSMEVRMRYKSRSRIYPLQVNIRSLLRHDIVDEIMCFKANLSPHYVNEIKTVCQQFGVSLLIPFHIKINGLEVKSSREIGRNYFYVLETTPRKTIHFKLKSLWEGIFALMVLLLLSPLLIIMALIIKITSPGPVIFKQLRVGLRGRKFYIYKFRTMVADAEQRKAALLKSNEADGPAFKIINDPRITKVGKFLRKTGIDEIPQFYNVIRGDMSLIGPRPLLPEEVSGQEDWHLKRMCIKPGITCTWQIQPSRNKVPFNEWMMLDKNYVEKWSVTTDIKIIFHTIKSIFAARGA